MQYRCRRTERTEKPITAARLTSTRPEEGGHGEAVADGAQKHAATEYGATVAERIDREEGKGPNDWQWVLPSDMVRWAASAVPHQETWQDHDWGGRTEVLRGHGRPLTELQYNANGQVISKTVSRGAEKYTWKYDWNARGELIAVTTPNGKKWEYRYDASGRRIEKKCPTGDSWRYIWMGHELLHTLKNDKLVESYLHEPGGRCPILRDDGAIHFILPDQNASPAEEVGPDGKIEYLYQKGTWGEGFQRHGETGGQPFLGQWFDAESGLHYNHFRYYDPETGRYLSPDPIGLAGGFNVYGGVSDPFCQYDRFGLATNPTNAATCPNSNPQLEPEEPPGASSRVIHKSQIGELGAQEGTVVLGHYSIPYMVNGQQVGLNRTLKGVLRPAAIQLGGTTLEHLPGNMGAIGPELQSASRIVFFTSPDMRGLTAEEMHTIQSDPALSSKTVFVYGGM